MLMLFEESFALHLTAFMLFACFSFSPVMCSQREKEKARSDGWQ
jgi:hypothetical protein